MEVTPGALNLAALEQIYRFSPSVRLTRNCRSVVDIAADMVKRAAEGEQPVYGINTGFGKLAQTQIAADETTVLQRNLILSHCGGVGKPLADNIVRLIIALKLASLGRGASGVRWQVIERLEALLERGITPVIPSKGSVGASGDLAPLAHLTAAMLGEGRVRYHGQEMDSAQACSRAGLEPLVLGPKEGLAMVNGTQVSTALALAGLFDAWRLMQSALITGALSCDALMASTVPFDSAIHALRGHQGQRDAAVSLRSLLAGSEIRASHREHDERVQDPYCFRCQPQVMGACIDVLRQVARTLEIEANAVTDNPLVIQSDGRILSGGNFHAEPVALAADQCALAIAEIGSITERRVATLVDPALNYGLPAFLSPNPGLNSGFMVAEVTAAALMSENKQKATPCSIDSTPTSANQEDHVSMACHGARRLLGMNRNLAGIIGIEYLTAVQGVEFRRPLRTGKRLEQCIGLLRNQVAPLEDDRALSGDIEKAQGLIMDGQLNGIVDPTWLPVL